MIIFLFQKKKYCLVTKKDDYLIKVFKDFLKSHYCICSHCNSKNIVKNGSRNRKIRYIPIQNYNIKLEPNVQRYICKDCKKPFSPSTDIVSDNSSISNNLKYAVVLEIQKNISLTTIAKRYNKSKNIIDILEDRRLHSLTECFSRFSLEARNNVKYICMDMYTPYISLVNSIFPNAKIVLDKFHIVNLVNRAFNQARISIMNSN